MVGKAKRQLRRQEHDAQGDGAKTTLFVRNLAFSVTSQDLEDLFSDIAPVKQCFVVNDSQTGQSRGFGYVRFALHDDAAEALNKFQNSPCQGRNLKLDWAERRQPETVRRPERKSHQAAAPVDEDDDAQEAAEDAEDATTSAADQDQASASESSSDNDSDEEEDEEAAEEQAEDSDEEEEVEADTNLDDEEDHSDVEEEEAATPPSQLKQHMVRSDDDEPAAAPAAPAAKPVLSQLEVEGFGETEERTVLLTGLADGTKRNHVYNKARKAGQIETAVVEQDAEKGLIGRITFKTIRDALKGVNKLHLHEIHGARVQAVLASQANKATTVKRPTKRARLILRNLAFEVDEEKLRRKFTRFGKIVEIKVVRDEKNRSKGFGFLEYATVGTGATAIREMNGVEIEGRPMAVDWALSKRDFERLQDELPAEEMKGMAPGKLRSGKRDHDDEEGSDEDMSEDEDEDAEEMDEDEDEEEEQDDEDAEEIENDDEDTTGRAKRKHDKKPRREDVDEGKTLFIRNLAYDMEDYQLQASLGVFGDLEYAVLVRDRETGRARGTGFVKFKNKADADSCLQRMEDTTLPPFEVSGRPISVSLALSRNQATEVSTERREQANKADKRNLYLSREGFIPTDTQAWVDMSSDDQRKRRNLEIENKAKMKNPNMFVSKTRLSVHNLPKMLKDAQLKAIFRGAGEGAIKQVKVVRDRARVDREGNPRSLGYGFVEFKDHESAVQALRTINNNPTTFTAEKRPIVMFAWDKVQILKQREARQKRLETKKKQFATAADRAKGLVSQFAAATGATVPADGGEAENQGKRQRSRGAKRAKRGDGEGNEEKPAKTAARSDRPRKGQAAGAASKAPQGNKGPRAPSRDRPAAPAQKAGAGRAGKRPDRNTRRGRDTELDHLAQLPKSARTPSSNKRSAKRPSKEAQQEAKFEAMVKKYKSNLSGSTQKLANSKCCDGYCCECCFESYLPEPAFQAELTLSVCIPLVQTQPSFLRITKPDTMALRHAARTTARLARPMLRTYADAAPAEAVSFTFTSASGTFYDQSPVQQVNVPALDGEFGILASHVPVVAALKPGVISVVDGGSTASFFVSSGVVTVNADSSAQVVAEEVARLEDLDITTPFGVIFPAFPH
ncbi:uncharacterized protein MONBRDRAFT_25467 [Monosiga brevicollis MX1]|uniref:RRM domain-containing protein n=1 Tax=Monosiga brevicollis TaxID=81824 RepID=A9UZI0_MONBE|nr:uncharacterized protein MONBRDRAFT_25467 [Monosiga brevicollis MX1]EDQ89233.1 predicted protein [Monosiga brevicollis MX1]|eukprot:XP_001745809.1 hypothetical protein [Monosiga brevicollis MX1]